MLSKDRTFTAPEEVWGVPSFVIALVKFELAGGTELGSVLKVVFVRARCANRKRRFT